MAFHCNCCFDLLIMQVGNYIHNMATFFSGLAIGFVNCWQIALITLASGPFIVAAGGISNIFLHRLAENIQDAYAEAASIAEQVFFALIIYRMYFSNFLPEISRGVFQQLK